MNDDQIKLEAAFWVERINRPVFDVADGAAFDEWMRSDPLHREAFAAMAAIWDDDTLKHALAEGPSVAALSGPDCIGHARRYYRQRITGSLSVAAAVMLGVALFWLMPMIPRDYESGPGEFRTIALRDGSRVSLGGNSAVEVRYLPWRRSVRLTRGEAAFDVAHETDRPFQVDAGATRVSVLGTAFHVDRFAGEAVGVQVSRGLVQVGASGRAAKLHAGEAVRVTSTGMQRVAMLEEDRNWRSGWFVADNAPLGDLVGKLNRYSDVPIAIPDKRVAAQSVVGRFKISDEESVLNAIAEAYHLKIVRQGGEISIVKHN